MNKKWWVSTLVAFLVAGCSGKSMELTVPPASENSHTEQELSWWSRAAMDAFMRYSVWSGGRSGFVTMFAHNGEQIYANAAGWADVDAQVPMQLDTPMRFASMTKPVTAVAAMMLVEQGKLNIDDPVAKYIPAYANLSVATSETQNADGSFATTPLKTPLLVRHLLLFSSGVGPGLTPASDLTKHWDANGLKVGKEADLAERVERLAKLPLFEEPGTRWRYGGSADVLARVVEVASGESFDRFLQQQIFAPLGMSNTSFFRAVSDPSRLAKVYTQNKDGDLILTTPTLDVDWTPGGYGLVSTAGDYMRFALMLWNGGEYQGARILSAQTVAEMSRLHLPEGVLTSQGLEGIGWGLGMSVLASEEATLPGHVGDMGWGGYYGTTFFISPSTGLVGVVLSQNEPGEFSGAPMEIYVVQGLGISGL